MINIVSAVSGLRPFGMIIFELMAKNSVTLGFSGHLVRGAFLKLLRSLSEELANSLHSPSDRWRLSPYSVRPILPEDVEKKDLPFYPLKLEVCRGRVYHFEVVILDFDLYLKIVKAFMKFDVGVHVNIRDALFSVENIRFRRITLNSHKISDSERIFFQTPTYFRSPIRPGHILLPLPELFFGSVAKIWFTFIDPIDNISERVNSLKETIIRSVRISALRINSVKPITLSNNRRIVGFIGNTTYDFLDLGGHKELIGSLLWFSTFSNVGGHRSGGFGAIRVGGELEASKNVKKLFVC